MPLTYDELCRIADLVRLEPPAPGDDPVARDLERMLELVGELPEMPAGESGGGPALPRDAVQGDAPGEVPAEQAGDHTCLSRDVVLANAPATHEDLVTVPPVLRAAGAPLEPGSDETESDERDRRERTPWVP